VADPGLQVLDLETADRLAGHLDADPHGYLA
jgi:hypothetical protein